MGNSSSAEVRRPRGTHLPPRRNQHSHLPPAITPRAAVVGAGLAGLHTAKELAALGFDVTVFDPAPGPATAASQHCPGAFGAGVAWVPSLWILSLRSELFWGLFPLSARSLVGGETPLTAAAHSPHWRWAYNRFHRATDGPALARAATYLAAEAEAAMLRTAREAPALAAALLAPPAPQPPLAEPSPAAERYAAESGGAGAVVDVPRWAAALEALCREQYGVRFAYGVAVTRLNYELVDSLERMNAVILTDTAPAAGAAAGGDVSRVEPFDLAVLCCGSPAVDITWKAYPVPLLPLAGYGVTFPTSHSAFEQVLGRRPPGSAGVAAPLSADGVLRLTRAPPRPRPGPGGEDSCEDRSQISGLLSLDARRRPAARAEVLAALGARLRMQCGADLGPIAADDASVETFRWVRHFTPDGLPLISRLGNAQNVFVCTGFGDDAALFSAGAARVLARLVTGRAEDGRSNPFSLARFATFRFIIPEADRASFVHKAFRTDSRFALWSEQNLIEPLRAVYRGSGVVEYLGLHYKSDV